MHDPHVPPTHHVHETAPMHDPVDQWHDHTRDEQPQKPHADVQNSNLVLGVGIALAVVIALSCAVVYGFYIHYNSQRTNERENAQNPNMHGLSINDSPAIAARNEQRDNLARLRAGGTLEMPTEQENVKKTVTIRPLAQAMEIVADRYTNRK